jgi:hypothetical protein
MFGSVFAQAAQVHPLADVQSDIRDNDAGSAGHTSATHAKRAALTPPVLKWGLSPFQA